MYILLVASNPDYHDWTTKEIYSLVSGRHENRLFEYTDTNISEKYKNRLEKLKELPCLFTYEFDSNGKTIGYVGDIKSIDETHHYEKKAIIKYSLDKNYPPVKIDKNNDSELLSLGTSRYELHRTHLAVKDINLFKFISKSLAKQVKKPRYTKKQTEDIWGKNYTDKTLLFFNYKAMEDKDKNRERMAFMSNIKAELEKENFRCFIAKKNIKATLPWKEEIFKALDTMHIFVGFVTNDFHEGIFTNQEIGYALKRNVSRIFLELEEVTPNGFLFQEQTLTDIDKNNCHTKIIETIKERCPDLYIPVRKGLYQSGLSFPIL